MMRSTTYRDKEFVREQTRNLIERGDRVFHIHRLAPAAEDHVIALLRFLDPPKNAHIVDLGCGVGGVADIMKRERADLAFTLVNVSAEQLDYCDEQFARVAADFQSIPLESQTFDAAMILYAVGHGDIDVVFSEAARILKSGGALLIYDLAGEDRGDFISTMFYEVHPLEAIVRSARAAGMALEKMLSPSQIFTEHMRDKVDAKTLAKLLMGMEPALLKFRKP